MTTTVRIRAKGKDRLRRIQEHWRRARGEAPSQTDVLEKGLEFLEARRDEFIASAAWTPWTEEDRRRFEREHIHDWGVSLSDRIDEIVYGDDP